MLRILANNIKKGELLPGGYLNLAADGKHATNAYHNNTYGEYNNVQQAAEPLYWKSKEQETLTNKKDEREEF